MSVSLRPQLWHRAEHPSLCVCTREEKSPWTVSRGIYEQNSCWIPRQHCLQPLALPPRARGCPAHPTARAPVQQRSGGKAPELQSCNNFGSTQLSHSVSPSSPLLLASLLYYCWGEYSLCWLYQVTLCWCSRECFFLYDTESFDMSTVKSLKSIYPGMNEINEVLGKVFCTERFRGFAHSYQLSYV